MCINPSRLPADRKPLGIRHEMKEWRDGLFLEGCNIVHLLVESFKTKGALPVVDSTKLPRLLDSHCKVDDIG
jgi:hypothetical protein